MRVRASLALLTLLPLSAFSVAADGDEVCTVLDAGALADDPSDDVLACETTGWLAGCDAAAGGKVHHALVHGSFIPLTDTAPASSFTEGAGCGTTDDPLLSGTIQETPYSLDIKGYLEANPDTLTVELHDISASEMRSSREVTLGVRISVEGYFPLGSEKNESVDGTISESPLTLDIPIDAVDSATGVSDGLFFTITSLSDVLPDKLYEAGAGDELQVIVTIDPPLDGAHAFVWGASEIPASVTFNGDAKGTVYDAETRKFTRAG